MNWPALLTMLFGTAHDVQCDGDLLHGSAQLNGQTLAVVGTTHHAAIGVELALAQARVVLDTVRDFPGRAIVLLVDTQGQVYDQALSGGFITSGLLADACYALPEAEIRVMRLPAMARVTKLDEQRLAELSKSNPVFAPGVENYVAMGGIEALWRGDFQACLVEALQQATTVDKRAAEGAARGGRLLAAQVAVRVVNA